MPIFLTADSPVEMDRYGLCAVRDDETGRSGTRHHLTSKNKNGERRALRPL